MLCNRYQLTADAATASKARPGTGMAEAHANPGGQPAARLRARSTQEAWLCRRGWAAPPEEAHTSTKSLLARLALEARLLQRFNDAPPGTQTQEEVTKAKD